MKKLLFIAIFALTLGVVEAKADNDRVISTDKLPVKAQQFITSYFSTLKISYVKEERDFLEKSYEVVFTDGTKLEFGRNGEWKEVDCRYSVVPSAILPDGIARYVKENYPNEKVLKFERDKHEYEVRLSNKLELTFDKEYNLIDIDD